MKDQWLMFNYLKLCFVVTTCQRHFERMMESSIVSDSQPRSVAVGDVNNDNQIDIVVANSGSNTIGIFLSKGNGLFEEQKIYPTGPQSCPYSIVISDFNNDNYLDIAVANYGINSIGIFFGHANGNSFSQKLFSTGSSRPLFITTGDFNNDNQMDIIIANYGTNNIGIFLGYGNGSFQDQITYFTGYDSIPFSLAVGNFNNDNNLDIAIANYGTNNIGILLGYGNASFASQQIYTTLPNSNPSSIAVGDFNNDNQLDIIVANNGTGNIGIFLGHSNGTFLAQKEYSIGFNSHPQYITVGDINKDYKLDIIIADSSNNRVHILSEYENGTFTTITTFDTISQSNPVWIAVADFDHDNQSDIVVANYGTNNVLVLTNYSIKPSARKTICYDGPESSVLSVAVSDFNNDNILDIVFSVRSGILILTGLGNGIFGRKAMYSTGHDGIPQYICAGDVNNDSRMDIVIADKIFDGVGVFLGYGNGNFSIMMSYSTGIGSKPWWIALSDINNDHRLDIVSANTYTSSIGIFLGNGDGTFATMISYSTGINSQPYSVAVGDINNDNYLDLVVANWQSSVIIFLGHGNGTFIMESILSTLGNLFTIALADFNSDNHLDIAVANTVKDNVGVFLGYGNGTFATQTTYSTDIGSSPYYVIVADLNNDNIYDMVVTTYGHPAVLIFYGYINGSFQLGRRYPTGDRSQPYGIVVADLDNNKHLEIVVALSAIGDVAILTEYNAAEFVHQNIYSTGSAPQPFSVAIGDFNNDNRSDIVVANSGTGNLSILLGLDNGTFGMEMMYSIGTNSRPQYVITCDINKDNKLDIVSVNSKNETISILMGQGNGTFSEQIMYRTGDGSYPYAMASGDFNNDSRLDFVIANKDRDSIGIFFNFNYTTFQRQVTFSNIDDIAATGIVARDFNHDNLLDIAVVFSESNSIGILIGYGNGSFINMKSYPTGNGSEPHGIAVGDFNNDAQLDIVVTNMFTHNIGIFLGYDNGSFADIMTYSTGKDSTPYGITVADFNNDGQLDIVVASYGTNSIIVLQGYGTGAFSIIKTYSTGAGSLPYDVTAGDFNNDGQLDIAVANIGTNTIGVLLGYSNGTFRDQMTFSIYRNSQPCWVTVGDFDNNKQLDIATALYNGNAVGILLGFGNGSFSPIVVYSTGAGTNPRGISVGDFNNDNRSDIVIPNTGGDSISVLFGLGDGNFLLGRPLSTGIQSSPSATAIGDFNNDTQLDVAVAKYGSNNIEIFLGYGSEPFGTGREYFTGVGSQPHSVAVDDFNSDGRQDIAIANYGTGNVGIMLGDDNGYFAPMKTYSTGNGSTPYSVAIGNFNNDYQLDIVVTNSETDNIAILFGYSNGTFASPVIYSTGNRSRPYTVAIGDFNNDNISDIAVANSGTNDIFTLYGYRNGTFANVTTQPLGYAKRPYSIAVKDLNQDSWLDIVIAYYTTDQVETLIKMC
ncbi:unnamed protein product [Rotaria sordida]|uniref:Uncharacterized protein n=1 Tax=Rotaria sordida TaxID=392033 RepID=A0A814VBL8_9BILA|nr:unnamed protein product [Rotaria sordida]